MYDAIIWDLDGTLIDTTPGVIYAVKYTINEFGLEMPDEDMVRKFVGPPMQLSFQRYFGMDEESALKAANQFRFNYKEHSLLMAELYPGTLEVLENLKKKGYRMAVATNKSHDNAIAILNHFRVADYCEFMMGSDLAGKLKKADIIESCLEELNIKPDDAVYIGDSIFDLDGAENMGMNFIGVTYGFGFKKGEINKYQMLDSIKAVDEIL